MQDISYEHERIHVSFFGQWPSGPVVLMQTHLLTFLCVQALIPTDFYKGDPCVEYIT